MHPTIAQNENIAASIVTSMTHEKVTSSTRMTTGDRYFVFDIKTTNSEYVIRWTDESQKKNFIQVSYWKEKLIPKFQLQIGNQSAKPNHYYSYVSQVLFILFILFRFVCNVEIKIVDVF